MAACIELWLERGIRHCKEVVHGHVSKDPEVTFANAILREVALAKLRLQRPELHCMALAAPRERSAYDDGVSEGDGAGTQLVGKGKCPRDAELSHMEPC